MSLLQVDIKQSGYNSKKIMISNIKFHVQPGELVGLIGPNGAGKSTTIKTILGILPDSEGYTSIIDEEQLYSYIPEQPILYDGLTLWEHIELVLSAFNKQSEVEFQRVETYLKQFRLYKHIHEYPTQFSKGMQQKVMLILGLILQPQVYLIDEPFIGLDPMAMKDFVSMLEVEKERGAAILMSTHMLDTAERLCDRFIIIDQGKIVGEGTLHQLQLQTKLAQGSLYECFHHLVQEIDYE